MPRNGSGVASVVNTFTPLTTADANQVNDNFTDMASMITDSLPRDGQAGMTGQFLAISGTQTEPGIAFTADPNTGIRRTGGDAFALVCGGVDVATVSSTGVSVTTAASSASDLVNKAYVDERTFAGEVKISALPSAPTGWLECNGSAVLIATYPALGAAIYVGDTLNATAVYGYRCTNPANPTGTRSVAGTYIVVPDLRADFVRGWDHGRGIDTGRAWASFQADELEQHIHALTDPGHAHAERGSGSPGATTTSKFEASLSAAADQSTNTATATTGITIAPTGGSETRPRNTVLMFIIKT